MNDVLEHLEKPAEAFDSSIKGVWEILYSMQVRKQQLELDMEQQTGSK